MGWGDVAFTALASPVAVPYYGYKALTGDNQFNFPSGMPFSDLFNTSQPQMSAAETEYLNTMNEMLQQQMDYYNNMMPYMAHQMHYSIGANGEWTKMSDEEWLASDMTSDTERQSYEINKLQMGRYKQALEGELPLSKTMQTQREEEFKALKASGGITGSDYTNASAEDTIGIQKLKEFKTRWGNLEEAAGYGELNTAGSGMVTTSGLTSGLAQGNMSNIGNTGSMMTASLPGYQSLLQPYQAYNQMGLQAQATNQATQASILNSLLGAGMFGAGIALSSKKFKKDIKKQTKKDEDEALKKIIKSGSYKYRYKKELGLGDEEHLGGIVEHSPKELHALRGNAINLEKKIELMGMGLKSLTRKVEALRG